MAQPRSGRDAATGQIISAGDGVAVAQEFSSKEAGKGLHDFDSVD